MTDQEIIIEVAKLDGKEGTANLCMEICREQKTDRYYESMGVDYLVSRDAIVPVIEKQDEDIRTQFFYELMTIHNLNRPREYNSTMMEWTTTHLQFSEVILSSSRQLCIALLKATGKYVE